MDTKGRNELRYISTHLKEYDDFISGNFSCTAWDQSAHLNSTPVINAFRESLEKNAQNYRKGKQKLFANLYTMNGVEDELYPPPKRTTSNKPELNGVMSMCLTSGVASTGGSTLHPDAQPYSTVDDNDEEDAQRDCYDYEHEDCDKPEKKGSNEN